MLLKPGKTCDEAIGFLESLRWGGLNDTQNAIPHTGTANYAALMAAALRKYDEWTGTVTEQMLAVFADRTVTARLRGERYGLIVGGNPESSRTAQLMYAEINELQTFFNDLANELRVMKDRYSRHRGRSLILDTNSLLHYQRLDKIPWVKLYGPGVCVVIPHVVVDEIDRKSYTESEKIRTRARGVYRVLEQMLDEIDTKGFITLSDGSTLEILADDPGHRRLPNNDDEVVARATFLQQAIAPQGVTVITRDIGMRTRARAWQLKATKLPDKFLIPPDKLSTSDLDVAMSAIEIEVHGTPEAHDVQRSSPSDAAPPVTRLRSETQS